MTEAYLIDPFNREVRRVELTSGTDAEELHEIYALLDCGIIEAVAPLNAGSDLILVDEEGKVKGKPDQHYFMCRLWPHDALAGKALWVGRTRDGATAKPESKLDYVREHIVWSTRI